MMFCIHWNFDYFRIEPTFQTKIKGYIEIFIVYSTKEYLIPL